MRAVILEIRDGVAAALREDGVVVQTRQACQVGDTIELLPEEAALPRRRRGGLQTAGAALLALSIAGGTYTYAAVDACAYVSIDVEASAIELSVNRLGRVIGVRAVNADAETLARELGRDVRRMRVDDALDYTMARLSADGYLDSGDSAVIAGVAADSEKRSDELTDAVERSFELHSSQDARLYTMEGSRDLRGEAAEQALSLGRYIFQQVFPEGVGRPADLDDDDWDDLDDFDDDDWDDLVDFDDDRDDDDRDDDDDERSIPPARVPAGETARPDPGSSVSPPTLSAHDDADEDDDRDDDLDDDDNDDDAFDDD
jgi:hypothetical protein